METITIEKKWINCLGFRIYVEVNKTADPPQRGILLLHEGLGSVSRWKDFPQRLALRTQSIVIAYDRPGYGLSSKARLPRSVNFLQEEADEILPCVINEFFTKLPYFLFGHSDGGSIALAAAGHIQPSPSGVIVEAPHVMIEEQTLKGLLQVYSMQNDPEFISRLKKYHEDHTVELLNGWLGVWMKPEAKKWNIFDRLSLIKAPLLFIQGTEDQFGTLQQWEEIRKRTKGPIKSLILEGCGHVPHQQATERVLEAVSDFLRNI
ncbi:MAG: hypothetical protein PWR20_554 [Bacteroidales bacterium]|jgi:pimeloyl-ACP methyl ester carboxylesterase|nr:hypothetical protein [Bacteroidales bacterium]MDN5328903.1 hypothetical protein [Bacteroidales bacterium]NLH51627.1 alpha/beta hydrolase [Bacteroidales bacterium]NPV35202.1 alpha/beta hydrolase [Bacteroidales bacterium]